MIPIRWYRPRSIAAASLSAIALLALLPAPGCDDTKTDGTQVEFDREKYKQGQDKMKEYMEKKGQARAKAKS